MTPSQSSHKRTAGFVLLIVLVAVVQLLCVPGHYLGQEHDDVQYVLASLALKEGRYSLGISPGNPPLTFATPGWPALLLPAAAISCESPQGYQLWSWLWLVAADILALLWFRRRMGAAAAAAATALFGLSPLVLSRSGVVMSEIPFLSVALALLLLVETRRDLAGWKTGLLLGGAWLVRPGALPLFAAVWGLYVVRGERRAAGQSVVAALAPILVWQLWVHASGARLAEFQELLMTLPGESPAGLAALVLGNARSALTLWGGTLLPWTAAGAWPFGLGLVLFSAAVCAIAVHMLENGYEPAGIYLLGGAVLHVVWPWWYERYLPPYLPFLIWGLYLAGKRIAGEERRLAWGLALLALGPLPVQGTALLRRAPLNVRPRLHETYSWIRERTPNSALFAGAFYSRDAFYTGRPFVPLPGGGPLLERLHDRRVRYVLWVDVPALGSSLGPRFHWRRVLNRIERRLAGPGFRRVFRHKDEGAAVFEVL